MALTKIRLFDILPTIFFLNQTRFSFEFIKTLEPLGVYIPRMTTKQARFAKTTIDGLPTELLRNIAQSVVDRRALRLASKNFSQTLEHLECVNAKELEIMRQSQVPPCKNTARVMYKSDMNMQRAIMCAIMSPDNKLHVYVDQDDLAELSESVECFDQHYALELALLYKYPDPPPSRPEELRCAGGFRPLEVQVAEEGIFEEAVGVVRFGGNTTVEDVYRQNDNWNLVALLDVSELINIRSHAFAHCIRLSYVVGDMQNLHFIGRRAFAHCTSLRRLGHMPELDFIEEAAFMNCVKLLQFDAPNITTISNHAFAQCRSLAQLGDMPLLKTIENGAFLRCESLAQISFGKNSCLRKIGEHAFKKCANLQKVRLPNTLRRVHGGAFEGCPLRELTVQRGADFKCACMTLVNRLRLIGNVKIIEPKNGFSPFRIQTPIDLSTVPGRSNDNPIDLSTVPGRSNDNPIDLS